MSDTMPTVPENLATTVEDVFAGPEACEVEQLTRKIDILRAAGRTCAQAITVEIARGHELFVSEKEWLRWGRDSWGYGKPFMHQCNRVGAFLLELRAADPEVFPGILPCAVGSLDALNRLYGAKPEQFRAFLGMLDVGTLTRDQVRAKVALMLDDGVEPPEGPPADEPDAKDKLSAAIRKVIRAVDELGTLTEGAQAQAAPHVHPVYAVNAGVAALNMAMDHLSAENWLAPENYERLLGKWVELDGRFRGLARETHAEVPEPNTDG